MATHPPETIRSAEQPQLAAPALVGRLDVAWAALHRQAEDVARLARIAPEPAQASDAFASLCANAHPWQRTLALQGIEDIAAMLASGLAALATLSGRGQDTAAPALTLWREFHAAREALLSVLHVAESA